MRKNSHPMRIFAITMGVAAIVISSPAWSSENRAATRSGDSNITKIVGDISSTIRTLLLEKVAFETSEERRVRVAGALEEIRKKDQLDIVVNVGPENYVADKGVWVIPVAKTFLDGATTPVDSYTITLPDSSKSEVASVISGDSHPVIFIGKGVPHTSKVKNADVTMLFSYGLLVKSADERIAKLSAVVRDDYVIKIPMAITQARKYADGLSVSLKFSLTSPYFAHETEHPGGNYGLVSQISSVQQGGSGSFQLTEQNILIVSFDGFQVLSKVGDLTLSSDSLENSDVSVSVQEYPGFYKYISKKPMGKLPRLYGPDELSPQLVCYAAAVAKGYGGATEQNILDSLTKELGKIGAEAVRVTRNPEGAEPAERKPDYALPVDNESNSMKSVTAQVCKNPAVSVGFSWTYRDSDGVVVVDNVGKRTDAEKIGLFNGALITRISAREPSFEGKRGGGEGPMSGLFDWFVLMDGDKNQSVHIEWQHPEYPRRGSKKSGYLPLTPISTIER